MTGLPAMALKMPRKSFFWNGNSFMTAARRVSSSLRDDHLAHVDDAFGLEEHVFGAREADAFGAECDWPVGHLSDASALVRTLI